MSNATPSLEKLERALAIAQQIRKLEAEMASIFGGKVSSQAPAPAKARGGKARGGKRSLSPEARERIAAAQRARWAKTKGAKAAAPAADATPKPRRRGRARRKISAEAREKMAAAAKRRWAKVKAKA